MYRRQSKHATSLKNRIITFFSLTALSLLWPSLVAWSAPGEVGSTLPDLNKPLAVSKVDAVLRQLKSSQGKPFTLVEYTVPTADAVPHILAVDRNDYVWFSESGGQFAGNFIQTPSVNKIGRIDKKSTI